MTIVSANQLLIAAGNKQEADRFFAPGYVAHVTDRELTGGPEWVRRYVGMLHDAFADLEVTVEVLAEAEDRVAWLRTVTGTQTGSFMGFPATDRRIVWQDMVVSRFRQGLIVEEWVVSDLAERLLRARKHGPS
jgi:predicted ester cyclase